MKRFLACLIAILFLFEAISVGVPMTAGRLSVSASSEDDDDWDDDYDDDDWDDEDDDDYDWDDDEDGYYYEDGYEDDEDYDDEDDEDDEEDDEDYFEDGDVRVYSSKSGLNKADYEKTGNSTVMYSQAQISEKSSKARVAGFVKIEGDIYKVTAIDGNAFWGYGNLKKVKVGKFVKEIGEGAFAECPNLTKLVINSKSLTADSIKGSLKGSNIKKIVVPPDMVKTYTKIFTKSVTGSKTDLIVKAHPTGAEKK